MSTEINSLIRLLPAVYQRTLRDPGQDSNRPPNPALQALLEVMVELQRPSQEVLAELETYFDPYQAPDAFVPLLASWLDLDWLFTRLPARLDAATAQELSLVEICRLRELVAAAPRLAGLRGTAQGLLDFLETASSVHGMAVDDQAPGRNFHLQVWAPSLEERKRLRAMLERMLQVLKPAYTTAELFTADHLARHLTAMFNLPPGLPEVQATLQANGSRPRPIRLEVALKGLPLTPEQRQQITACIDGLTPLSDNTAQENAGVWRKTFREWRNSGEEPPLVDWDSSVCEDCGQKRCWRRRKALRERQKPGDK